jgi:hypothetical protein
MFVPDAVNEQRRPLDTAACCGSVPISIFVIRINPPQRTCFDGNRGERLVGRELHWRQV